MAQKMGDSIRAATEVLDANGLRRLAATARSRESTHAVSVAGGDHRRPDAAQNLPEAAVGMMSAQGHHMSLRMKQCRQMAATAKSCATLNSNHHRHGDDRSVVSRQELSCELSSATLLALETVKLPTVIYPAGAMLFGEDGPAQGVFVVSSGRVKLSLCAEDGKTLILRVAEAGEMLGIGATVCGRPYEATAQTMETSEISFIPQSDLLRLMRVHNDFALHISKQLSKEYNSTCDEIRSLLLSHSVAERLARVLLEWLDKSDDTSVPGHFRLTLTHDEIAQLIGTSRETVTRQLAVFQKKQFIQKNGATLVVLNRGALQSLVPP